MRASATGSGIGDDRDRPRRPKIDDQPADRGIVRQFLHEPVIEFVQALDDDLGLPQDRHEIGVAVPARHDMPVEMPGQAGTGGLALIQADIITLRAEHPIEDHGHPADDLDRLDQVRALELAQRPPMDARGHQEMPIIIRITIEDDDGVLAARDQQVLAVLVAGQPAAEEAAVARLAARRRASWMYCARQGAQIRFSTMPDPADRRTVARPTESRSGARPRLAVDGISIGRDPIDRPRHLIVAERSLAMPSNRHVRSRRPIATSTVDPTERSRDGHARASSPIGRSHSARSHRSTGRRPDRLRAGGDPRRDSTGPRRGR